MILNIIATLPHNLSCVESKIFELFLIIYLFVAIVNSRSIIYTALHAEAYVVGCMITDGNIVYYK